MSNSIRPFSTTGIGSVPHTNPKDACDLILSTFDIPFWPQLPKRSFRESMVVQYTEGMPYVKIDEREQVAWVMRDYSDELERFYESCTETARIAVSEEYALGLHTFLKILKGRKMSSVKGHVTGPLTFTLGLKDNLGRFIYFDEELREIAIMLLQAKARWQIDVLRHSAERVIVFVDEPILTAMGGSSYLGVDNQEVVRLLHLMVSAIKEAGGISGIHCCGRADWPLVMKSGVEILSFDAYEYFETLAIYSDDIGKFLENGGYLAWGIVPSSDVINTVSDDGLAAMMKSHLQKLCRRIPPELVRSQILLTPACGTGTRSIEETTKIFQLVARVKESVA